jgi:hypothetical protein
LQGAQPRPFVVRVCYLGRQKLRRRKVRRVVVYYAVMGWGHVASVASVRAAFVSSH